MAAPKKKVEEEKRKKFHINSKLKFVLLSSLAVFFLLIANSAIWVNKTIFNTQNFSQTTTDSLLSESSRNALANEVVDQALANRPLAKNVVQEPATKFISGLLATSQAQAGVQKVAAKLQIVLTSKNNENIEIDLSGIKQTVAKLIDLAGKEDSATKVEQVPDKVTLLDVSKLPKFYKLGTLFMWLAPITFISGLLILAWPHIKARKIRFEVLLPQGLIVLAGYLLGLLMGPLFRPPVLSQFSNTNLRTVAENLYNSFVASFNSQLNYMLGISLIMIGACIAVKVYNFIKSKK